MALAGDIGCSAGPTVVGLIANAKGGDLQTGLTYAMIFPLIIFVGIAFLRKTK